MNKYLYILVLTVMYDHLLYSLLLPDMNYTSFVCLRFHYFMTGSAVESLNVYSGQSLVWSRRGHTTLKRWYAARISYLNTDQVNSLLYLKQTFLQTEYCNSYLSFFRIGNIYVTIIIGQHKRNYAMEKIKLIALFAGLFI